MGTPFAELTNHFQRGVDKNQMQIDVLLSILLENDLPQLPSWESEVTDSKVSPFSDKLLLFKATLLSSATAGQYGANLASVFRKDLGAHYTRVIAEELLYGEDSVNLMIKHQFSDQLPLAKESS
nr:DUF3231 family protein [Paenisporosarcina sp. TG20]